MTLVIFYFTFVKMISNQHVFFPTFQSNCEILEFLSFSKGTCHHFIEIIASKNYGIFLKKIIYKVLVQ